MGEALVPIEETPIWISEDLTPFSKPLIFFAGIPGRLESSLRLKAVTLLKNVSYDRHANKVRTFSGISLDT